MRGVLPLLGALAAAPCLAGHGLMNAFADIEWLPDPGYTPGQILYPVDRLAERAELALATSAGEALEIALRFAREKLAEAAATIRAGDEQGAASAIELYRTYIERGRAAVEASAGGAQGRRRAAYIDALLEHVYIMSVEYVDFPLEVRERALGPFFAAAMRNFEIERARLASGARAALFFKEEEIRWSLEMTRQADLQRIVN